MKKRQKKSKGPIVPPSKPVDFTARSGNGLGDLGSFPREIRNMIYSSLVPQVMPHAFEHKIIDPFAVRKLINAPILGTSKQLCVEFLEIFIQKVNLEESDEDYDLDDPYVDVPEDTESEKRYRCKDEPYPDSLERLLGFVEARIGRDFTRKRVGLKINTLYLDSDILRNVGGHSGSILSELPVKLRRLWNIHERYDIPSEQIYINIDYWEPSAFIQYGAPYDQFATLSSEFWSHDFEKSSAVVTLTDEKASIQAMNDMSTKLKDQLYAYKATKLQEFRKINNSEVDYVVMEETLNWYVDGFYEEWPIPEMLDFHTRMGKTAINFWKAKGEQYSVWHLFDLAESWLEVKNE
ncbi:hypothetical protein KCU73_g4266, partial [Aureobasidium melanogenum]